MQDKIYEKLKEDSAKSDAHYLKKLGIITDEKAITGQTPKKNMDLMTLLSKLELIENTPENLKTINEFHDYLFKLGIEVGIGHGKRMVIESIKADALDFKKLMGMDPKEFVTYNMDPTFIEDMKEAFANEK